MPGTVAPQDDILLSGRLLHRRWMSRVLPDGVLVEEPIPSFTIRH